MTLYLAFSLGVTEGARPKNMFLFALGDITCLHTSSIGNEQIENTTCVGYLGGTGPLFVVFIYFTDTPKDH